MLQSRRRRRADCGARDLGLGLDLELSRSLADAGYRAGALPPRRAVLQRTAGVRPRVNYSRKGRARWRLRAGDPVGATARLSGGPAWALLESLRGQLTWSGASLDRAGHLARSVPRVGLLPLVEAHYVQLQRVESRPRSVRVRWTGAGSRARRRRALRQRGRRRA